MKRLLESPWTVLVLLLLACVRFESRSETGASFTTPGLAGGIVVLAGIVIVLLFKISNAVQDALIARGWLGARVRSVYEVPVLVGAFLLFANVNDYGEVLHWVDGEPVYAWEFHWSDPALALPFAGALVAFLLLHRALSVFRAVRDHASITAAGR